MSERLFVLAGIKHRFENFSDDFTTRMIFHGPEDGERPAPSAAA
ncbi:MAG: hypothetical protein ABIP44_09420 [Pseudoxanthomonas sp.]